MRRQSRKHGVSLPGTRHHSRKYNPRGATWDGRRSTVCARGLPERPVNHRPDDLKHVVLAAHRRRAIGPGAARRERRPAHIVLVRVHLPVHAEERLACRLEHVLDLLEDVVVRFGGDRHRDRARREGRQRTHGEWRWRWTERTERRERRHGNNHDPGRLGVTCSPLPVAFPVSFALAMPPPMLTLLCVFKFICLRRRRGWDRGERWGGDLGWGR